ncbi:hypothetical protein CAC42_261 [Sphaceloma murrayae]|uniref:Uncharacterized protein n=1 Tax=Sphaceloma murrayae TaxID=2082308 RepID=A0A2K1QN08_9PEZI|nr:hypothetical protein CAC42_261 [Sphaceloma murrayae]
MASSEMAGFVCRSCARRAQSITPSTRSLRHFSQSSRPRRSHAVPDFTSTSSSELNEVLSTLRNDHILPAYLNRSQQRLVFRKKYRSELENSSVTVSVEHEDFELKALDRGQTMAERKPLVKKAIDLVTQEKAWGQVYPLLEGLAKIRDATDQATMEKLIRRAAMEGRFGVVVQCLKAAERTGLTMRDKYVFKGVLRGLRQIVERRGWEQGALDRAIRYGNEVAVLMVDGEHMSSKRIPRKEAAVVEGNPLKNPISMATWLELHAVRAYKYGNEQDDTSKLKAYHDRIVSCFNAKRAPEWLSATPLDIPNQFLRLLPLWQGVLLTNKVLRTELPPKSKSLQDFAVSCGESLSKTVSYLREQGDHPEGSYAATAIAEYDIARKHIYSKDRHEVRPAKESKPKKEVEKREAPVEEN